MNLFRAVEHPFRLGTLFLAASGTFTLCAQDVALADAVPYAYGFIENKGQVIDQDRHQNREVRYLLPGTRYNVTLKPGGYSYDLFSDEHARIDLNEMKDAASIPIHFQRVDFRFEGSSIAEDWQTSGMAPDHLNVINEHGSFEMIRHYGQIDRRDLYPGVHQRFAVTAQGSFKHDVVAESVEALDQVRMRIEGATVSARGTILSIATSRHSFVEEIPMSYVERANGTRDMVQVNYRVLGDGTIGFALLDRAGIAMQRGDRLVVDPTPNRLRGSYYSGLSGTEEFRDAVGTQYFIGHTSAAGGFASVGAYDASYNGGNWDVALVKMSSCARLWATYYGGAGDDRGLDGHGIGSDLLIGGSTNSSGGVFGTPGVVQPNLGGGLDGYLARFLGSTGFRVWGTYVGGTSTDDVMDVDTDGSAAIYLCGSTNSTGMNAGSAHQATLGGGGEDGYWRKYNITATSLIYSTYYGGAGGDKCMDMSQLGNEVYLCGYTYSASGIATSGAYAGDADAFIVKFNNTGVRQWGKYFGGPMFEAAEAITLTDCPPHPVMGGRAQSTGLATAGAHQTTIGGFEDGYIARYNSTTGNVAWATYYGGMFGDNVAGLTASKDNFYIVGTTNSPNNISTPGTWQETIGGGGSQNDAFFARFLPNGTRQYGSYYGGSGGEYGQGISGGNGTLTIVGATISANTGNCIASAGCYDVTLGDYNDAFFATFDAPVSEACSSDPKSLAVGLHTDAYFYPVPFQDQFTLSFSLTEPGAGMLRLFDMQGRLAFTFPLNGLQEGANLVQLSAVGLAPGMYTWQLAVGDFKGTGRVVRME